MMGVEKNIWYVLRDQLGILLSAGLLLVCNARNRRERVHVVDEFTGRTSHGSSGSNTRLQTASRHLFDVDKEQIGQGEFPTLPTKWLSVLGPRLVLQPWSYEETGRSILGRYAPEIFSFPVLGCGPRFLGWAAGCELEGSSPGAYIWGIRKLARNCKQGKDRQFRGSYQ